MNETVLRDFITKYGEDKIAGFYFDNNGRKLFTSKEPFKLSMIDGDFLVFDEDDLMLNKFKTHKPIETIQGIITVETPEDRDKLDKRYMAS